MATVNPKAAIAAKSGKAAIVGFNGSFDQIMKRLFANGEQGFAYDPNDLTTMWQDAAGTIPVTAAGQPVGLMLDKSKGLARGATNFWTGTPTRLDTEWADNGDGTFTSSGSGGFFGITLTTMVIGRFYEWTFEVTSYTSGKLRAQNAIGVAYPFVSSVGTFTQKVICSSSSLLFYSNAFFGTVRPISVRELAGNPAYSTTSARRPLLVANPQRLDYDAVDDKLTTTLPTQLTGCTVVRSVPNVGTQILTGQTIPATYEDNIDNCGLIVINRALTASETTQITKLFNKAAGV